MKKIECISSCSWDFPGGRVRPGQIFEVGPGHHKLIQDLPARFPKDFREYGSMHDLKIQEVKEAPIPGVVAAPSPSASVGAKKAAMSAKAQE